jgi:hypothetical protein
MNGAVDNDVSQEREMPLRGRRASLPCHDGVDSGTGPEPRGFVVDLLEDTGPFKRSEAEPLLSWLEWVEAVGEEDLLEGLRRLRGAVVKAAAVGTDWPGYSSSMLRSMLQPRMIDCGQEGLDFNSSVHVVTFS